MGLRQKILLLVTIPMIALLILSTLKVYGQWKVYKAAELAVGYGNLIQASSKLVHELQKERGKSVLYINGALKEAELKEQRNITSQFLEDYNKSYSAQEYPEQIKNAHNLMLENFESARRTVDAKTSAADAIRLYSGTIRHLFTVEISLAEKAQGGGHEKKFTSTAVLGLAKENAGKTRALFSGFLAANKPLTSAQVVQASSLRSGILENLESPTLIISDTARAELDVFKESTDWKAAMETINYVLENAGNGEYNKDAKVFFDVISSSINKLGTVIFNEQAAASGAILKNQQELKKDMINLSIFFIFMVVVILSLSVYFIKSITTSVQNVVDVLKSTSKSINATSNKVLESSSDLSQTTTQQAAAVQETVASLEEISAMVGKTAENAKNSTHLVTASTETVTEGQETIHKLNIAIGEISKANENINKQIQISHEELDDIVKLINDISNKTKVINDIVFQTKLLSFNASVEAARAGEAGKGFAVVAEEVGKLAIMSGNAAQEITDVLAHSVDRVHSMIDNTKKQVSLMMVESRSKVDQGERTASQCSEVLKNIVTQVQQINVLVAEISNASTEQTQGIVQISKAMNELDHVAHNNSNNAQLADENGRQLDSKARELNEAVSSLTQIIDGKKAA